LLTYGKIFHSYTKYAGNVLSFPPYAARTSTHEKKSQAETGVEIVFQIFLFLLCFYVCFCLCLAFPSLPFSSVVTGLINLHITELVDISPLPTQIQFAITISATPVWPTFPVGGSETAILVLR